MLKIKLTRNGKRGQPNYRIVVNEARSKRDGKYTDYLGYYNPLTNPADIQLDTKKYQEWLDKGAQPTKTVQLLFQRVSVPKKQAKQSTK